MGSKVKRKRPRGNYVDSVLALGLYAPGGQVARIEVRHDDDCGIWNGNACDCRPEVEIKW